MQCNQIEKIKLVTKSHEKYEVVIITERTEHYRGFKTRQQAIQEITSYIVFYDRQREQKKIEPSIASTIFATILCKFNRKNSIANNMPQLNWNQHFGNCGIIY